MAKNTTADNENVPVKAGVDPVFKSSPKLDVYYRTADGSAFYTENAAKLHAAGLDSQEIKKITRK